MNWVLALFAFAGIMAVMSTIASVLVEAVHKGFALRSTGLRNMLHALHDQVVLPLDSGHPDVAEPVLGRKTPEAVAFAKEMTKSPTFGGANKWSWIMDVPFFGLLRRRYENLSKIQFVEQLAQTDFGRRLAQTDRSQIRQALNRVVYEFDRFGSGQSEFFKARAKILTTIIALLVVTLGNINAFAIYRHLATDEQALRSITSMAAANPEALIATIEQRVRDSQSLSSDEQGVVTNTIVSEIRGLADAGFPIGRDYFPYCGDYTFVPGQNPPKGKEGCDIRGTSYVALPFGVRSYAIPRMLTPEGAYWFLGMIGTAGLIGLGANFWFNVFRAIGSLAVRYQPQLAAAQAAAMPHVQPAPGEVRRPKEPKGSMAAPGEEPDLDVMTDAFLTVSGRPPGDPPLGRRLGDATADRIGETAPSAQSNSDAVLVRRSIRRLRS